MPERRRHMSKYDYITKYSSGNYTPKRKVPRIYGRKRTITGITIHHWGIRGQAFFGVVNFLCRKGGKTSAHYVAEAGRVACIVAPKNAAWHAGNGKGNATTVGIECRPEATDADYATVAQLIADIRKAYGNLPLIPHRAWKATSCPGVWDLARLDREARAAASGSTVKPSGSVKPKPKPKPKPKGKGWPDKPLKVTSKHTKASDAAWHSLMGAVGYKNKSLTTNMQRWLKSLRDPRTGHGYYRGIVEADHGKSPVFGAMLTKALQRKLYDTKDAKGRRIYNGAADGNRGSRTVKAEIKYLNLPANRGLK